MYLSLSIYIYMCIHIYVYVYIYIYMYMSDAACEGAVQLEVVHRQEERRDGRQGDLGMRYCIMMKHTIQQ